MVFGKVDRPQKQIMTLNKQQRDLAVTALEMLQNLAQEVMMYGSIANAVSWNKIRNVKSLNIEQSPQLNNEAQEVLNKLRTTRMTK